MPINERLKQIRKQKHITQVTLAKMLNVKQVTISQYESGRIKLTLDKAIEYSKAFNCSLDELIKGIN